jgi:hypothetical protein
MDKFEMKKIIETVADIDGSLRDIYIFDVTFEDWDVVLDMLKKNYRLESDEKNIPKSVKEIIPLVIEKGFSIRIYLAEELTANCHFFVTELSPMEFDLDPKEMQSPFAMAKVLQFISQLGDSLNKKVVLTEENSETFVLLSYSPISKKITLPDSNGDCSWSIHEALNEGAI